MLSNKTNQNKKQLNKRNINWDLPSSYTGTVKRRPLSFDECENSTKNLKSPIQENKSNKEILENDNKIELIKLQKSKLKLPITNSTTNNLNNKKKLGKSLLPKKSDLNENKKTLVKGILKPPPYRNPPAPPTKKLSNKNLKISPTSQTLPSSPPPPSSSSYFSRIKEKSNNPEIKRALNLTSNGFIVWKNSLTFRSNNNNTHDNSKIEHINNELSEIHISTTNKIENFKFFKENFLDNELDNKNMACSNSETENVDETVISTSSAISSSCSATTSTSTTHTTTVTIECDILTKPEFSSSLFKNLPVRPRKGVPHMENYCLFDPSVDFINEKELMKQKCLQKTENINSLSIISIDEDDLIEEIIYEDQLICDPLIHQDDYNHDDLNDDSYIGNLKNDNEKKFNEKINDVILEESPNYFIIEPEHLLKENNFSIVHEKSLINNNLLQNKKNISAILKKSPQIDKLFRQSSLPICPPANQYQKQLYNNKILHNRQICIQQQQQQNQQQVQSNKLENDKIRNNQNHNSMENLNFKTVPIFDVKNSLTTINNHHSVHKPGSILSRRHNQTLRNTQRPLSNYSDADSGFLSPITPPDSISSEPKFNSAAFVVLEQCDSIQVYIEVSKNLNFFYIFSILFNMFCSINISDVMVK